MVAKHTPVLKAPYYADDGDGTLIHRYLDDDFVNRHLQAMQQGTLSGNSAQLWRFEDRFADDKSLPWLRLPVHRTFYMVSCEVVCDAFGQPAFDPQKITSAGFVVRRRDGSRWLQINGVAQGWHASKHFKFPDDDPDNVRQLRRQKLIRPRLPEPLPSGEETYPMHAQLVDAKSADGRQRKHTLLFGYLPLSGAVQSDVIEKRSKTDYFVDTLPWPFGRQDQNANETLVWRRGDGHLMSNAAAQPALAKLINQLVSRYQLLDALNSANHALNTLLEGVHFYRLPDKSRYQQTQQALVSVAQQADNLVQALGLFPVGNVQEHVQALKAKQAALPTLPYPEFAEADDFAAERLSIAVGPALQWLSELLDLLTEMRKLIPVNPAFMSLQSSITVAETRLKALQSYLENIDNFRLFSLQQYLDANKSALLAKASSDEGAVDLLVNLEPDWHVFFSEKQAFELRELLFERSIRQVKEYVDSLQIARYQQEKNDIYYLKPFVRYLDDKGCEQIVWGGNSESFRVAAPFDPEASRPQAIQMPKLSDLKRGLAKGATFVAPKDLAATLKNIGMEMPPTEKPGNSFGLEWIISFSLPVITICAMLLLMIVLNILNLFFQWLPYAITLIPKPK